MATDAQNSPFMKHLASSDKKTRDTALQSLRTYLSSQKSIPELDLLKLWKGLFYCLWMQDKPLHQQRLSQSLASLPTTLQPAVVLPFFAAFWKTIAREWTNIEALRMDKYLYLIRCYVGAGWKWLAERKWRGDDVRGLVDVLGETPLEGREARIPNGLRFHVLDVYLDELEKVREDWEGGAEVLEGLMKPVEELARLGRDKSVRKAAKEVLGDERLKKWRGEEVEKGSEVEEDGNDDEEWGGIED